MTGKERLILDTAFDDVMRMRIPREEKIEYFLVYIGDVINSPTPQEIQDYVDRIR